ncbi:pyrroline-5-carboxylate reductase [Bacillus sp. T33-2]|uniref:pyrroline-5-carboxylate reductase n=1 Tax=Bacillus sp. T33-2 TaxID=2054168 RepID=UPI000C767865|nr:pyrroline-5-carboxylate reductase [Bacillus sp. T33-2]PLR97845.1 pyrroline-5-carboxylate reductase [Bacillus sp. T33-2]
MNQKRIGFIGSGKMARAMIAGLIGSKQAAPENIMASAATQATMKLVEKEYGISVSQNNSEIAGYSDYLVLAVKPGLYESIISEIKPSVKAHTIIISIAAGISLEYIENMFGRSIKAVRTMPNTPSLIGEGISAICPNRHISHQELDEVLALFRCFGQAEVLEEALMDAVPAVSGSSPAYVYMMIEALADGGVLQGIPRDKAYRMAAQAVLGAAKMVLETGEHPAKLKDDVCTPGGATIEAVAELEKLQFRAAVISAMERCTAKSKILSAE